MIHKRGGVVKPYGTSKEVIVIGGTEIDIAWEI